ncbi:MAG: adenosine deaminase [Anaerolineaceae bacterium]|nr:adenosine deaminase [Anaerolineaceae bacterium]
MADDNLRRSMQALPKVELHRHLEGSIRLSTLVEVAQEYGIEMPEYDIELLRPFVQMMPTEAHNSQHFLAKFMTIRQFFLSEAVIRRMTHEVVEDAALDNVKYFELRFTPRALSNILNCSFEDVLEWVCSEAAATGAQYQIQVRLIVSVNRHESFEIAERTLDAVLAYQSPYIVAFDLAGNEKDYAAEPFRPLFERAKNAGLGVTIHAGEWGSADNIRSAVSALMADRIGHGVRAIEDLHLCDWLMERGTVLEVCPTSNVHSGAVEHWSQHPLGQLYRYGINTTINTDDPLVSDITLTDELVHAIEFMSFSTDDIKRLMVNAAQAAFLAPIERNNLVSQFSSALGVIFPS